MASLADAKIRSNLHWRNAIQVGQNLSLPNSQEYAARDKPRIRLAHKGAPRRLCGEKWTATEVLIESKPVPRERAVVC